MLAATIKGAVSQSIMSSCHRSSQIHVFSVLVGNTEDPGNVSRKSCRRRFTSLSEHILS
jgi:hypothetical protein